MNAKTSKISKANSSPTGGTRVRAYLEKYVRESAGVDGVYFYYVREGNRILPYVVASTLFNQSFRVELLNPTGEKLKRDLFEYKTDGGASIWILADTDSEYEIESLEIHAAQVRRAYQASKQREEEEGEVEAVPQPWSTELTRRPEMASYAGYLLALGRRYTRQGSPEDRKICEALLLLADRTAVEYDRAQIEKKKQARLQ